MKEKAIRLVLDNSNIDADSAAEDSETHLLEFTSKWTDKMMDVAVRKVLNLDKVSSYFIKAPSGEETGLSGDMPEGTYVITPTNPINEFDEEEMIEVEGPVGEGTHLRGKQRIHLYNGHEFIAKHFHTVPHCAHCKFSLLGLGKQGYLCLKCDVILHKKCSKEFLPICGQNIEDFPECEQCRRPFLEVENHDSACLYHFSTGMSLQRRMQGWCSDCGTLINSTNVGCKVGPHVKREKKSKKSNSSNSNKNDEEIGDNTGDGAEETLCECESHLSMELFSRKYTLSVSKMYDLLFSDESLLRKELYESRSYTDISQAPWEEDNTRAESYIMPLNAPIGPKAAKCFETQTLEWRHEKQCFVVQLESSTPDVPYGTTFTVFTRYCVSAIGEHRCRVRVTVTVNFSKRSAFTAGLIVNGSKDGIKAYLADLVPLIKREEAKYMEETGASAVGAGDDDDDGEQSEEETRGKIWTFLKPFVAPTEKDDIVMFQIFIVSFLLIVLYLLLCQYQTVLLLLSTLAEEKTKNNGGCDCKNNTPS